MHRHFDHHGGTSPTSRTSTARTYMGRHGHHRFGHFAGGFTGSMGMGGRAFRAGRRLASGDLQLVLLALLAERPSHGYELIKALEERSGGFYSPSPGMIYPALTWLEEVGYASVAAEGAKKLYSITATGQRVPAREPGSGRCHAQPARAHRPQDGPRARDLRRHRRGRRGARFPGTARRAPRPQARPARAARCLGRRAEPHRGDPDARLPRRSAASADGHPQRRRALRCAPARPAVRCTTAASSA